MAEWWKNMELAEQIFFILAAPSTLILFIQTILLFFGMGDHGGDVEADTGSLDGGDMDGDFGGDLHADGHEIDHEALDASGMRLFTVRGLVAFFCVTGWAGMMFIEFGLPLPLCVLLSALLGFTALLGIAYLAKSLMRLQENGTTDIRSALGKTGQVYLTIPAVGAGQGKVNVVVNEALREFIAVTSGSAPIPTGSSVRVTDVNAGVLTVERD